MRIGLDVAQHQLLWPELAERVRFAESAGFDGAWSILIVTQAGECDKAYRYAVQIDRGQINYDGTAGVELSGSVDRSGRVSANVQRGDQGANGTGRLAGNRGRGTWRGKSSAGQCSGYWEAERR